MSCRTLTWLRQHACRNATANLALKGFAEQVAGTDTRPLHARPPVNLRVAESGACETPAMVSLQRVSRIFGKVHAVKSADLTLSTGQFMTIVGPSGCGKTTLLRMIAGFDRPDSGQIFIHDQDVARVPPYQRSIGMVFQKLALFPHMTAAQNVAYPLRMRRFDPATIDARVARFLTLVRLEGLADRYPHELSGGQQQRVAIARALSFEPDLLLLDEPLSALDRKLREDMQLEFRRIQQQLGVTTINVTHDQREALVMSDQMVVMNRGQIEQHGTPGEIYRQPRTRFVASFIGTSSCLPGVVIERRGQRLRVRVGKQSLLAFDSGAILEPGAIVDLMLRAEQVRLAPPDLRHQEHSEPDRPEHDRNELTGYISQCIYEGDRLVYAVRMPDLDDRLLLAYEHDTSQEHPLALDSVVTLHWQTRHCLAFANDR